MATGRSVTVLASRKASRILPRSCPPRSAIKEPISAGSSSRQQPRESGVGPPSERQSWREQQVGLGGPQQALILLVGHQVDAFAEPLAAGPREDGFQPRPVFHLDHVAAEGTQQPGDLLRAAARDHAVQALAVQVHHPDHMPEALQAILAERLPDVTLVEFRVPHQGQKAMRFVISEMVFDIAADERHEIRHHRAESHRSSGKVDTVRIASGSGPEVPDRHGAIFQALWTWQ